MWFRIDGRAVASKVASSVKHWIEIWRLDRFEAVINKNASAIAEIPFVLDELLRTEGLTPFDRRRLRDAAHSLSPVCKGIILPETYAKTGVHLHHCQHWPQRPAVAPRVEFWKALFSWQPYEHVHLELNEETQEMEQVWAVTRIIRVWRRYLFRRSVYNAIAVLLRARAYNTYITSTGFSIAQVNIKGIGVSANVPTLDALLPRPNARIDEYQTLLEEATKIVRDECTVVFDDARNGKSDEGAGHLMNLVQGENNAIALRFKNRAPVFFGNAVQKPVFVSRRDDRLIALKLEQMYYNLKPNVENISVELWHASNCIAPFSFQDLNSELSKRSLKLSQIRARVISRIASQILSEESPSPSENISRDDVDLSPHETRPYARDAHRHCLQGTDANWWRVCPLPLDQVPSNSYIRIRIPIPRESGSPAVMNFEIPISRLATGAEGLEWQLRTGEMQLTAGGTTLKQRSLSPSVAAASQDSQFSPNSGALFCAPPFSTVCLQEKTEHQQHQLSTCVWTAPLRWSAPDASTEDGEEGGTWILFDLHRPEFVSKISLVLPGNSSNPHRCCWYAVDPTSKRFSTRSVLFFEVPNSTARVHVCEMWRKARFWRLLVMDTHGSSKTGLVQVVFHSQYEDCRHTVSHPDVVEPFFMQVNLAQCIRQEETVDEVLRLEKKTSVRQNFSFGSMPSKDRRHFRNLLQQMSTREQPGEEDQELIEDEEEFGDFTVLMSGYVSMVDFPVCGFPAPGGLCARPSSQPPFSTHCAQHNKHELLVKKSQDFIDSQFLKLKSYKMSIRQYTDGYLVVSWTNEDEGAENCKLHHGVFAERTQFHPIVFRQTQSRLVDSYLQVETKQACIVQVFERILILTKVFESIFQVKLLSPIH